MSKKLLCALFVLFFASLHAQLPAIGWKLRFGNGADFVHCIRKTSDDGFITCGERLQQVPVPNGISNRSLGHVSKISADGTLEWTYAFGGTFYDYLYSVVELDAGGYFAAGFSDSNDGDVMGPSAGTNHVWGIWLDAQGNLLDHKILDSGIQAGRAFDMKKTEDGGFILCGTKANSCFLLKVAADGAWQWQKTFNPFNVSRACTVIECAGGGYAFVGYGGNAWIREAGFVLRTDANGNTIWQKNINGNSDDALQTIGQSADGSFIVGGSSLSTGGAFGTNQGGFDALLAKLDPQGNTIWQKSFGADGTEEIRTLLFDMDGGYLLGGLTTSDSGIITGNHGPGQGEFLLAKTDSQGNFQWGGCYGGSQFEQCDSMAFTATGQIAMAGNCQSEDGQTLPGTGRSWVVKLGEDLSAGEWAQSKFRVYPNPASDHISFGSAGEAYRSISIFDAMGRLVKSCLSNGSGIDVLNLPEGIYILEWTDATTTFHTKFVKKP